MHTCMKMEERAGPLPAAFGHGTGWRSLGGAGRPPPITEESEECDQSREDGRGGGRDLLPPHPGLVHLPYV